MDLSKALNTYLYTLGLIICENIIVTDSFWDINEIKRHLALRHYFSRDLREASLFLLTEEGLPFSVRGYLRSIPIDRDAFDLFHDILQVLKNLNAMDYELPLMFNRVFRIYRDLDRGQLNYNDIRYFFMDIINLDPPAKIKTLFNLILKRNRFNAKIKFVPTPSPGKWFDLSKPEQDSLRSQLNQVNEALSNNNIPYDDLDVLLNEKAELISMAGISEVTILKEEVLDINAIALKESKQIPDALVAYLKEDVFRSIATVEQAIKDKRYVRTTQNEVRKAKTILSKISTLPTLLAFLDLLEEKNIFYKDSVEIKKTRFSEIAKSNLAYQLNNGSVRPIKFQPMSENDFVLKHNTGQITYPYDMDEEGRANLLGRLSVSLSDLEEFFGKGFCGKHVVPLNFDFSDYTGDEMGGAFFKSWNKNRFNPTISFGAFNNLVAHEISHFIDVLIADKLEDSTYKGKTLFGDTGVPLEVTKEYNRNPLFSEYIEVILSSPDYQRWKDLMPSFYEYYLPVAYKSLYGMDLYQSSEYKHIMDTTRKSQLPKELVDKVEYLYKQDKDGDDRKSKYFYSSIEIWARMCEQYIYTKMAKKGVTNPWLTQVSYDVEILPQAMDQDYFENVLEPIMDKIFATLKSKSILAKRRARYGQ